ncbi:hypothetical protein QLX08_010039 [Tetragonisca angustula]|uniref:AT-rich interactive domain-containing protein 5B n=2 Tax=Apinae TaxID=70987 RepID=A0AAW0ZDX6_9HYME
MEKIELLGGACFSHGPYTFYKAVRIGNGRVLRLGSFFLTKLWSDADLVSIGELQLLWMDSRGPNQPLASLRLYFLPENTPDGRRDTHGEGRVYLQPNRRTKVSNKDKHFVATLTRKENVLTRSRLYIEKEAGRKFRKFNVCNLQQMYNLISRSLKC